MTGQSDWVPPEDLYEMAGGRDFVGELVELFLSDTADRLLRLDLALRHFDHDGMRQEAHSLKSSAWQMGAGDLGALSEQLERLAGSGNPEVLSRITSDLHHAFEGVSVSMKAYL